MVQENYIPRAPGPASYTLPPVLGPSTVVTPAALAYSISGRKKVDSDLNKVCFILKYVIMKIIYLCGFTNICCRVWFPSRVQDLPTKLWTPLFTDLKLPSTAWQAATSHQMTPQGSQDLGHTILKRSLSCISYAKRQNLCIFLICWIFFSILPGDPIKTQSSQLHIWNTSFTIHLFSCCGYS